MARPSKDERNKDIIKKYDAGWGYERLGNHFNLHFTTVKEIILRWYPVYGKKDKIANKIKV
jgi:Mor family transcriptional regulator